MKVCIATDYNVHDYPATLARAFNEHTEHEAKLITFYGDPIQYDPGKVKPVILTPEGRQTPTPASEKEAHEIVEWADFFFIGRRPLNFGKDETATTFEKYLTAKNTIFLHWGSVLRNNKTTLHGMYEKHGYIVISSPDVSCLHGAGEMMYHFPAPYDREFPAVEQDVKTVKICHKTCTPATKGTDYIRFIVERLAKDMSVELVVVEGEKHEKCLELVADCQICIDEISDRGCYHSNTLEAMAMGQVACCSLSPFFMSIYPDCPVVNINRMNAEMVLTEFVSSAEARKEALKKQAKWLKTIHSPKAAIGRYERIMEMVTS